MPNFAGYELNWMPDPVNAKAITMPNDAVALAKMCQYNLKFARDKNGVLYLYKNGVYRVMGMTLSNIIQDIVDQTRLTWSTRLDNTVTDYILKSPLTPELPEKPYEGIINMQNGLWFIDEERFEPHDPKYEHWKYYNTCQLPINYDETADCPQIKQFMKEVFPEGPSLLFDVIGLCMTSDTSQHKAVMLLGEGSNGKSMFLTGLRAAIGHENVSSTTIHMLCDPTNKFANSDLVGKLVNASDDTPQGNILDTANIKSIISGNPIRVEGKHKQAVTYKPYCKLIFGTNHRLTSNDESAGYMRRLFHIPFAQKFSQSSVKDKELNAMWKDPTELSGLFNEIKLRLKTTVSNGFEIPDEARQLVETYDPIPDMVVKWLKDSVIEDSTTRIPCYQLHGAMFWQLDDMFDREKQTRFVTSTFPQVSIKRPRIDGKQVRCYVGIGWKDKATEKFAIERSGLDDGAITEETDYLN